MKYLYALALYLLAPMLLTAQNTAPCAAMLKKAQDKLAGGDYNKARDYCEAALPLCPELAADFDKVQDAVNKGIEKEKVTAKKAQKEAEASLKKLQTANENFVRRFLQNARADMSAGRFADALDKIKAADELNVLRGEVGQAYLDNVDSSLVKRQLVVALNSANRADSTGQFKADEMVRIYLKIVEKSILYLEYEVALEATKMAAKFSLFKSEVSKLYLEIAFWQGETGHIARSAVLLDSIAQFTQNKAIQPLLHSLPADTPAAREHLRSVMKKINAPYFDTLFLQKYYPDAVAIKGGTFNMGCDTTKNANCGERETLHTQEVSSFFMARTETTVWQYALYVAAHKGNLLKIFSESNSDQGDNPVVNVSWYDAVDYANWVSQQKGLDRAITQDTSENFTVNLRSGYRLPTEAEWEYAAGGGNAARTIYAGTDNRYELENYAWYNDNSGSRTHPVAGKKANILGLYDMSGNIWEWCWDWYGEQYYEGLRTSPEKDPVGPLSGSFHVLRGVSWSDYAEYCRVSFRNYNNPGYRYDSIGFRLVFVP